ncbi:MAG: hypothetical protein M5U34_12995 [Chloroflexi bacterium]|nr:hypothetical protein [Chloroflexota bacterium]
MITKRVVRFLLVVAFSITIGLWGWLTWRSSIVGASPSPGSPEALGVVPAFLATSADGRIQYGYGVELPTRFAGATVEYDAQTVAGIEQYVTFNQTELERLLAAADEKGQLTHRTDI